MWLQIGVLGWGLGSEEGLLEKEAQNHLIG